MRVSHYVAAAALLLIATVATASETGSDANTNIMLNQAKVGLAEKLFKFEKPVVNGDKATVRAISGKKKCTVTLVHKEVLPAIKGPTLQLEASYGWLVDKVVCK